MNTNMRGVLLALSVLLLGLATAPALAAEGAAAVQSPDQLPNQPHRAAVVGLTGEVDDFTRADLERQFHDAEASGADTIILDINTYGGQVTAAMDISRFIKGQTSVHTIAYVDDKAISAGSMIAVACDEIVMRPSSTLGDCAPIQVGADGVDPVPPTERAKFDSPVLAEFEDSARKNGYSIDVVDAFVVVDHPLYLVASGERNGKPIATAVVKDHYDALLKQGQVPYPGIAQPYMPANRLLTVDPQQAQMLGLSRGTAETAAAIAKDRGYTIVADYSPGVADAVVRTLITPEARFVTLVVFMLALYISLHAPGHGAAEALAIVALAVLVGVPLLTGYAQWWEVAMILVGLGLCAFEILVFPGHGVSLVVGSVMMVFGFIATFIGRVPAGSPLWHSIVPGVQTGIVVVVGALAASMSASLYLRKFLPQMPFFKGFILTATSGGAATAAGDDLPTRNSNDAWPLVGTVGTALTDLHPGGSVQFPFGADNRQASVVSASGFVSAGARVVVQEARGNRVVVRVMG
jgi:membrane-bound serine protease (ClpP class)